MARAARDLHLVNPRTGEIAAEACPGCFKRDEQIATLKVEKASWTTRYWNLRRQTDADHEGHDLFPAAARLFDYWRELCRHRYHKPTKGKCPACARTKFTVDRFNEVRPRLQEHGDEAEELCRQAIRGAAYDPFTTPRKNGTFKRHNDWHQIFAADKFMEFCNKAPVHLPKPEHVVIVAKSLEFLHGWDTHRAIEEARARLTK